MEKTKTNAENSVASSTNSDEYEYVVNTIATKIALDKLVQGEYMSELDLFISEGEIIRQAAEDLDLDSELIEYDADDSNFAFDDIQKRAYKLNHMMYLTVHPYKKITEEVRQSIDDAIKKAMDNIAANGYRTQNRSGHPYKCEYPWEPVLDLVTDELGHLIHDDYNLASDYIFKEYLQVFAHYEYEISFQEHGIRYFTDYVADYIQNEYDDSDYKEGDQLVIDIDNLYGMYTGTDEENFATHNVDLDYLLEKLDWADDARIDDGWFDDPFAEERLIVTVAKPIITEMPPIPLMRAKVSSEE